MIRRELLSMKKIILTAAVCLGGYVSSQGQVSLTIEKAMDIAEEHSPSRCSGQLRRMPPTMAAISGQPM